MEIRKEIVNIKTDRIYPHPDNPRKDLGDIVELADSIRKNGIMQNLTVVPITALSEEPEKQPKAEETSLISDFHVLIGHRRLAAAKEAGLTEVPCQIISKIPKKEQVGIMLEENMQRSDLTISEQAQGFQMMFDLGWAADEIAEKTGFSKTTIYHRLNIAKLNQKELKKKENDDNFQLSIKDLYALEQVESIRTRNRILKEAYNSQRLSAMARDAARDEARDKNIKILEKIMDEKGVQKAPQKVIDQRWSRNYEELKQIDLDKEPPKKINLKNTKNQKYYYVVYGRMYIVCEVPKEKKEQSEANKAEALRKKTTKQQKDIMDNLKKRIKTFIRDIVENKIEHIPAEELIGPVWECMKAAGASTGILYIGLVFTDKKDTWAMTEEDIRMAAEKLEKSETAYQMLASLYYTNVSDIYTYYGKYNEENAKTMKKITDLLEMFGFALTEDEEKMLDGTHELYGQEEV
jgi:hypothetical protein|nr:MAG TPA: chromosome partitioning protein [Caudoviricetes sp.]